VVYLVCPLSSAALAASLINAGVSKSGSPAPKPTTSIPAFFMALALALTGQGDRLGNQLHAFGKRKHENAPD